MLRKLYVYTDDRYFSLKIKKRQSASKGFENKGDFQLLAGKEVADLFFSGRGCVISFVEWEGGYTENIKCENSIKEGCNKGETGKNVKVDRTSIIKKKKTKNHIV